MEPRCGKCESTDLGWKFKAFGGAMGILVFCKSCGAVLAWAPKPDKE